MANRKKQLMSYTCLPETAEDENRDNSGYVCIHGSDMPEGESIESLSYNKMPTTRNSNVNKNIEAHPKSKTRKPRNIVATTQVTASANELAAPPTPPPHPSEEEQCLSVHGVRSLQNVSLKECNELANKILAEDALRDAANKVNLSC